MRPIRILVALLCLVAGVALGALNPQVVEVDLGLAVFRPTLGVALLATLLSGAIAGGLAIMVSVVLPLRHRRRTGADRSHATDAN
ncbi:lipopolysaccharide assembly protein LapA domain-containing protein [Luteimonas granuli]|uniref:LapA family protein n=1 Tax=Luteimonas granuli TaxID=1176533 RepID=A0A518N1C5_9GAMM|nr:LapA family protein [Luteimonas granuli]QDW65699.1 LapA family protein [Luteimonas granuli]